MTCNLNFSCGDSYRTYAAYKSHICRHHFDQLHLPAGQTDALDLSSIDNIPQLDMAIEDNDADLSPNDDMNKNATDDDDDDEVENYIDPINLFKSTSDQKDNIITILDIQKSFALFILQLREEFLLPKSTINSISSYIVTLVNHLQSMLEQKVVSNGADILTNTCSSQSVNELSQTSVDIKNIKNTINEVCYAVEAVTRNEYQFMKFCEQARKIKHKY